MFMKLNSRTSWVVCISKNSCCLGEGGSRGGKIDVDLNRRRATGESLESSQICDEDGLIHNNGGRIWDEDNRIGSVTSKSRRWRTGVDGERFAHGTKLKVGISGFQQHLGGVE